MFRCINAGFEVRNRATAGNTDAAAAGGERGGQHSEAVVAMAKAAMSFFVLFVPFVTFFGRFSHTIRLSEGRLRESINFFALVSRQSVSCGLHPIFPHLDSGTPSIRALQRRICLGSFVARFAADVALGAAASVLLVVYETEILNVIKACSWYGLYELHISYLDWFLGWPGGFKMNDELSSVLGLCARSMLDTWRDLVTYNPEWDWVLLAYRVTQVSGVFGISVLLGIVADSCNIATVHLRNTFHVFSLLYRGVTAVMSSLLLQFRGLKYNPLRCRVDNAEFAVDEVLLGTLLCTTTVFLLPTIALYYFYLALVRTSVWCVQGILQAMAIIVSSLPVYQLYAWCRYRFELPSGVALSEPQVRLPQESVHPATPSSPSATSASSVPLPIVDVQLLAVPMSLVDVFAEFRVVAGIVLAPLHPKKLLSFILRADVKPMVNARKALFPHLCVNCVVPPLVLAFDE